MTTQYEMNKLTKKANAVDKLKINAEFSCEENGIGGITSCPVKSHHMNDDGSVTVRLDYWPPHDRTDELKQQTKRIQELEQQLKAAANHAKYCEDKMDEAIRRHCDMSDQYANRTRMIEEQLQALTKTLNDLKTVQAPAFLIKPQVDMLERAKQCVPAKRVLQQIDRDGNNWRKGWNECCDEMLDNLNQLK